jgi:phage-related minor tail protein
MTGNILRLNAALQLQNDKYLEIGKSAATFLESSLDGLDSLTVPLKKATEEIKSFGDILKELMPQVAEGLGGALVEMVKGTGSIKDVLKQTLAAILRAYGTAMLLTNPVAAALAFAGAGAIMALAKGGIVTRPTTALIGEAGPEAVIPLNKAGGLGTTVNLTVNGSILSEGELIDALAGAISRRGSGY